MGVGGGAPDGGEVPDQRVGDHPRDVGDQRVVVPDRRRVLQGGVGRGRPDPEPAAEFVDAREAEVAQVDQVAGRLVAEPHETHEALAPGERPGVPAAALQLADCLLE